MMNRIEKQTTVTTQGQPRAGAAAERRRTRTFETYSSFDFFTESADFARFVVFLINYYLLIPDN